MDFNKYFKQIAGEPYGSYLNPMDSSKIKTIENYSDWVGAVVQMPPAIINSYANKKAYEKGRLKKINIYSAGFIYSITENVHVCEKGTGDDINADDIINLSPIETVKEVFNKEYSEYNPFSHILILNIEVTFPNYITSKIQNNLFGAHRLKVEQGPVVIKCTEDIVKNILSK